MQSHRPLTGLLSWFKLFFHLLLIAETENETKLINHKHVTVAYSPSLLLSLWQTKYSQPLHDWACLPGDVYRIRFNCSLYCTSVPFLGCLPLSYTHVTNTYLISLFTVCCSWTTSQVPQTQKPQLSLLSCQTDKAHQKKRRKTSNKDGRHVFLPFEWNVQMS